ncbi:MAG: mannose-1-phosphate guanylyltransferase [Cyclobacteriaceae bacterium]
MRIENLYVVIMAGGIGSRFWPYSRNAKPKQFIDVLGVGKTLLQMTYDRFKNLASEDNIYVVSNQQYGNIIKDQIEGISDHQVLLEPTRRNTAPCIAYAAYKIRKKDPNAVIVVSPADHAIFGETEYLNCISKAVQSTVESDKLITLGIQPTRPETGYGYIQFFESDEQVKKVKTFTEKPQLDLAKTFLASGDFVWNAGIFIWSVESIINAFEAHLSEVAELFAEGSDHYFTDSESDFIKTAYSHSKNISIDYGIMEKAENVYVVLGDFGWSDLGSWNSLYDIKDKDQDENVVTGNNALFYGSKNNLVHSNPKKVVLVQDLDGYLIADFDDVLVICKKDEEAKFREFVADVKQKKGDNYL